MDDQRMTEDQVAAGMKAGWGEDIARMPTRNLPVKMSKKKYVVPEGGLKAAYEAWATKTLTIEGRCKEILKAFIQWQSENPIELPYARAVELFPHLHANECQQVAAEWQRQIYLTPEPEVPEAVKDLLNADDDPIVSGSESNSCIIEAYSRGKAGK